MANLLGIAKSLHLNNSKLKEEDNTANCLSREGNLDTPYRQSKN